MQSSGRETANENADKRAARAGGLQWRHVFTLCIWLALLGAAGLVLGFVWFVERLPTGEPKITRNADGIVVLTGRSSRIGEAIELLAAKRGKRLLISGVYPTTTAAAIARLMPEHQEWFNCCVDLDHSAINTVGNAIQTRKWSKEFKFNSLIVVTSNYHMPRAMIELAHQLPDVELIAYAVAPERVHIEAWWSSSATARLLFAEYLKYLRAAVRTQTSHVLARQKNG